MTDYARTFKLELVILRVAEDLLLAHLGNPSQGL
jgi:hypothetical protein